MAKSKKRRPARPPDSVTLQTWVNETIDAIPKEERNALLSRTAQESGRLNDEPEFAVPVVDAQEVLKALLHEIRWCAPKILSEDERERWWFCHLARENVTCLFSTPAFRRLVTGCLDTCANRTFATGEREKTLQCALLIPLFLRVHVRLETVGLMREILSSALRSARLPDDTPEESRRCLAVFEEYGQLGDRDPFLQWAMRGYEPPSPDPYGLDQAAEGRIAELCHAISKGTFAIEFGSREDVAQICAWAGVDGLALQGTNDDFGRMQSAYQVTGAIHRSVRDFVALVHGTPKWDRLRTVLAILVSNASVAADPALRRWHGHWKEALDTFDHYYRGSHPVLMVELTNEVASFHHERRMAMMQHLREQAAAGGSDS